MKTFSTNPGREKNKKITCALCGAVSDIKFLDCNNFFFVKCTECGLVYQNPQPVMDALSARYGSEYFNYEVENEQKFFNLMLLGLKDIRFRKIEACYDSEKSFLDIGCATGMLVSYMKDRGWNEQGVEICTQSANFGKERRGVNIFNGTLEDAEFPDNSFSVIHCSHLIEHLTDPEYFIKEVGRILKSDGHFIIVTPNISGFQAKLFQSRWRSAIADHTYLFSIHTLSKILEKNGFEPVKIKTWGGLAAGSAPLPIKYIFDKLAGLFGFGDVMVISARKISEK